MMRETCRQRLDHRRHPVRGKRKPGTGTVAGSAMRSGSIECSLVFRRGDEACFHRTPGPDGRSDCASRCCLEGTHSLLQCRHLGRNLITVFSTVNTPCREIRARTSCRRVASRRRRSPASAGMDVRGASSLLFHRIKTSFFQRFRVSRGKHSRARDVQGDTSPDIPGCIGAAMNGSRIFFRRAVAFRRRTTRIARNCASHSAPNEDDRRVPERLRRARVGGDAGIVGCIRELRSTHAIATHRDR